MIRSFKVLNTYFVKVRLAKPHSGVILWIEQSSNEATRTTSLWASLYYYYWFDSWFDALWLDV